MTRQGIAAWAMAMLAPVGTARAIIKVELPVARICASAGTVLVGKIEGLDGSSGVATLCDMEVLKGRPATGPVALHVAAPAGLAEQVRPGQSVVVLVAPGKGAAVVVHLADTWLLGQRAPGAGRLAWRTVRRHDIATSFPGRTEALVQILREIRAGKATLRNAVSHEAFTNGKARVLGELGAAATSLASGDFNGDGRLDLVAALEGRQVRLLLSEGARHADRTVAWGLSAARADFAAAGDADADGKTDLLLGQRLWRNTGRGFAPIRPGPELPPQRDWLTAALTDADGDGRCDAVVICRDGKAVVAAGPDGIAKHWAASARVLWRGRGAPVAAVIGRHWGDDGQLHVMVVFPDDVVRYGLGPRPGPPADFQRLTGAPVKGFRNLAGRPVRPLLVAGFDYDGLKGPDLVLVTAAGGATLANRGFGSFLVNGFLHKQFHSTPQAPLKWTKPFAFRVGEITAAAPGRVLISAKRRRQDLFLTTRDGKLWELDNSR